jgi:hypothetical protein
MVGGTDIALVSRTQGNKRVKDKGRKMRTDDDGRERENPFPITASRLQDSVVDEFLAIMCPDASHLSS